MPRAREVKRVSRVSQVALGPKEIRETPVALGMAFQDSQDFPVSRESRDYPDSLENLERQEFKVLLVCPVARERKVSLVWTVSTA